ncbi:hypothetical protein FEP09_05457 [Burkholderia multivorans]|nr:hypothetical protein [Burkholderia multivorans]
MYCAQRAPLAERARRASETLIWIRPEKCAPRTIGRPRLSQIGRRISGKFGKVVLHPVDISRRRGLRYSGRACGAGRPTRPQGLHVAQETPPRDVNDRPKRVRNPTHDFITHPRSRAAFARPHCRPGRRADPSRHDRRDERLHRLGLPEGRAGRARRPYRGRPCARRRLPDQRADRRLDRPRTRRRARAHERHLDAAAVPVRPDAARQDQRRRSRLPGHSPESRRAVRMVRAVRRAGCRDRRSRRHSRGRAADSVGVGRQQQDVARTGEARDSRGQRTSAARPRRDARHLLRHRVAAEPQADPR